MVLHVFQSGLKHFLSERFGADQIAKDAE